MGDVGSMAIAFWILALIGDLILTTREFKWILLLTVYGTETVLTIIERLKLRENIFDAHRRHLYQLFSNDKKVDHRVVSAAYALIQLLLNSILVKLNAPEYLYFVIILIPSLVLYLGIKSKIKKQINSIH